MLQRSSLMLICYLPLALNYYKPTIFFYCLSNLDSFLIVTLTAIELYLIVELKLQAAQICLQESCRLHFIFFPSFTYEVRGTFRGLYLTFHHIDFVYADYQKGCSFRFKFLSTNFRRWPPFLKQLLV